MMPHIIPGGRQRASSDGDVLEDEEDTLNASGVLDRLTEAHRNVSRSAILSTTDDSDDSRSYTDASKTNAHATKKKTLKAKLSFKSVKKAFSRALQKDNLFGSASSLNKEEMPSTARTPSAVGVWTPTLIRRAGADDADRLDGSHLDRRSGREGEVSGTDSVSRPLITDARMMTPKWERTPGNVGLFNHGNTCFMNAVLQCLSHTDSFSEYFITDLYKDDLKNTRNSAKKLGSKGPKGDVTEQLGLLLKYLWTEKYNSEISIDFKAIVGKFNVQYKGNSQHDAQEFLLWLLDRVHEDLMQPSPSHGKKKAKQTKNLVGPSRSLSDVDLADAAESSLSSSFISRLFQALHRSSLTCPHCNRHSNTFDPYLCVSLPLPQKCLRPVYVTVVALSEQPQAVRIGLSLNVYDTVRELRDAVAADTEIPASQLVLCQLAKDGFCATFSNEQPLSDVPESDSVYAIEMHPSEKPSGQSACFQTPTVQILLLHVELGRHTSERFCIPEVIRISRETNFKNLQREILFRLGDAVKPEVYSQRLHSLFRLQIVDGSTKRIYLHDEVEMPLYTETVDRVLSMFGEEFGPQHVKLIAEWKPEVKETVIKDDGEHVMEDSSVKRVQASATQPVAISLDECFQLYTQEEKLAGEDAWLCPHCKKPQKGATKTLGLWSLPDILVLHLKRFKQIGMRRNKLNMLVNFPVEDLDMTGHVVQQGSQAPDDMLYDLIGVANHYGNMNGGHYTAFSKNAIDGTWREFDDRRVQALASDQVVTKSAYILFYQRRSLTKAINQRLHTGTHWVFSLETLIKPHSDKSTSPQRRNSSGSPSKRGDGYSEDLRQASTTTFVPRPFSNEWNGPSSPTRRPTSRPLTPQPPRKQISFDLSTYEHSPTAIKPRPSFRPTRPTLSRQLSDAAVRAKRQSGHDPGMADGHQRQSDRGMDPAYGSAAASSQIHPQALQVQLPPKASTGAQTVDIMGSSVPKGRGSDILQPQQVHLPTRQPMEEAQDRRTPLEKSSPALRGTEGRGSAQSSRVSGSSSYHSQGQPPSVDVRVVDSPSFHSYQDHPSGVRVIPQPISIPPRSGRPWQYESQSSQSSRDTQSSQDSHSPQQEHLVTKASFPNGKETFDWRQPEASTGADVVYRPKPTSSGAHRVVSSKPPIPPKTITGRSSDNWRKMESSRAAGSSGGGDVGVMLQPVTAASSSLTSPPSPAPRDSARDIPRRISPRESPQAEGDRLVSPRDVREARQLDRPAPDERPMGNGQFHEIRNKFVEIQGEQVQRRRRSQNLADQHKFATIARGNRDTHSEPRDIMAPHLVRRSATDHNIKVSNISPAHFPQPTQRSLAMGSRYSPQSDRASYSSSSGGYPRAEWDRDRFPAERDSVPVPMYVNREQSNVARETRTQIYRGPMFQHHRPKKTDESNAPSLRESSV